VQRRDGDGMKVLVEEQRHLRQACDDVDGDDGANHVLDRTQLLGQHRMTHAYISARSCNTHAHTNDEESCVV